MIIKRLAIKNFGKIHNKTLEFSQGINVLYGENESGKSTVHTFLKSMLYGIRRQRGKAAKNDTYTTYEPWENPASYGGTLWFENGGKNFRLTRNFHKTNQSSELLCEDDGELLDVEKGDLDVVLGGVSEAVFENTVSVAQLKSVTGQGLVRELQNYMASYQGTGDSSVDLGRTMQLLKMSRKGYQVQADRCKKDTEKEQEKLAVNIDYLRQEMDELWEKKSQISVHEEALQTVGEDNGEAVLDERIYKIQREKGLLSGAMAITAVLAVLAVVMLRRLVPGLWVLQLLAGIAGAALFAGEGISQKRLSEELSRRKRMKNRWLQKQEKLKWNRESLEESWKEKETALSNLQAEYREVEERAYLPLMEETEIEAINLAMKTIEKLSGNIHNQLGGRLRRRTSQILSEITGGKYREVLMDKDLHMTVNTEERTVPLESLSRGTLEQIYFALRMAAGELLCGEERFPVILDDVFGMYDEERLGAVLRWLHGENRQVIISTCHKREMEILEKEGIPYQKILL
ncbi:MAG: AAA family ATPase [Eubacteriales bacterium]|nr:AAA family ATPase [Eubacteriales bacterium]